MDSQFCSSMEIHQLHKKQVKCNMSVLPNYFAYWDLRNNIAII